MRPKQGLLLFITSCLSGCGQMYQGYMKRGVSLLLGFFTSCAIEFTQFFIGRSTDIDDVILNTAGALAGYWLFWLVWALFPNALSKFQCRERGDA